MQTEKHNSYFEENDMKKKEEKIFFKTAELSDEALSTVFGGTTIPESVNDILKYTGGLNPPATKAETDAINRIIDSLHTQGPRAAIALSKRLIKENPRINFVSGLLPKIY